MDEVKIASKFTQGIITKILRKILVKKLGIDPVIEFGDPIELQIDEARATVHIDVTVSVPKEKVSELIKDYI